MAVEAVGSKRSRNNDIIVAVVLLVGSIWLAHDGWLGDYKDKELADNDGKPTANLYFNQYAPIPLTIIAIIYGVAALRGRSRKIVADEDGIKLSGGTEIPYNCIKQIDKGRFQKKGFFTITYDQQDEDKHLKLSARKFDNLGLLLDELVGKTGAKPADTLEDKSLPD